MGKIPVFSLEMLGVTQCFPSDLSRKLSFSKVGRNPNLGGNLGLWSSPDSCSRSKAPLLAATDTLSWSEALYHAIARATPGKPNLKLLPSHPKNYCVSKLHIYSQKKPIVYNHCQFIFLRCRYTGYLLSVSSGPLSIFLHSALPCSAGLQKPRHQDSHDLWFLVGFGQREPWQEIKVWDEHEIRVCVLSEAALVGDVVSAGSVCLSRWSSPPSFSFWSVTVPFPHLFRSKCRNTSSTATSLKLLRCILWFPYTLSSPLTRTFINSLLVNKPSWNHPPVSC